eukprot:jgi/Mesen1/9872/ME000070S09159
MAAEFHGGFYTGTNGQLTAQQEEPAPTQRKAAPAQQEGPRSTGGSEDGDFSTPSQGGVSSDVQVQDIDRIARERLKFANGLTSVQRKAIECISHRQNVVVNMGSGRGKSACYVVPSLLQPNTLALVFEPYVSIIHDQCESLTKLDIGARAWTGDDLRSEKDSTLSALTEGPLDFSLLYMCPEALLQTDEKEASTCYVPEIWVKKNELYCALTQFARRGRLLLVVDEVHKMMARSNFRATFKGLGLLREKLENPPVVALSVRDGTYRAEMEAEVLNLVTTHYALHCGIIFCHSKDICFKVSAT